MPTEVEGDTDEAIVGFLRAKLAGEMLLPPSLLISSHAQRSLPDVIDVSFAHTVFEGTGDGGGVPAGGEHISIKHMKIECPNSKVCLPHDSAACVHRSCCRNKATPAWLVLLVTTLSVL